MKIDQFNDLAATNLIGSETRDPKDEFNSHLKKEKYAAPPEFSSQGVEDYVMYSETLDMSPQMSAEQRDRRSKAQSDNGDYSDGSSDGGSSGSSGAQSLTKVLVQQAVCLIAGAIIITSSYQTMVEKREAERNSLSEPPAAVVVIAGPTGTETEATQDAENDTPVENGDENESVESAGNDGESDGGSDSSGNGSSTSDGGSDSSGNGSSTSGGSSGSSNGNSGGSGGGGGGQSPAVHTFGTPTQEELGDGSIKLTYTCTECGETYVVIVTVDPEQ
ncbi:MAG: hypothetical protein IJP98_06455 [Clostridia bacterium]|nr:hypothetical protein [Clostridia bacterium]